MLYIHWGSGGRGIQSSPLPHLHLEVYVHPSPWESQNLKLVYNYSIDHMLSPHKIYLVSICPISKSPCIFPVYITHASTHDCQGLSSVKILGGMYITRRSNSRGGGTTPPPPPPPPPEINPDCVVHTGTCFSPRGRFSEEGIQRESWVSGNSETGHCQRGQRLLCIDLVRTLHQVTGREYIQQTLNVSIQQTLKVSIQQTLNVSIQWPSPTLSIICTGNLCNTFNILYIHTHQVIHTCLEG